MEKPPQRWSGEREVKEGERETVICGQEREWRRREMADQEDGHWQASELKIGKKIYLTMEGLGGNCLRNVLFIRLMVAHTMISTYSDLAAD